MEALLAQLLGQRALQTKVDSDAKHGPVIAQLRRSQPRPADDLRQQLAPVRSRASEANARPSPHVPHQPRTAGGSRG